MNKAVFFDRDGVINTRLINKYVRNYSEFQFIPEIFEILPKVKSKNYLAIVITNQQGIGKGLMSENDLQDIHQKMQDELLIKCGFNFDDIYFCSDLKSANSHRRKPSPGMLLEAAAKYNIDLDSSFMIGDSLSDTLAANAAGVTSIFISSEEIDDKADFNFKNHKDLINQLNVLI